MATLRIKEAAKSHGLTLDKLAEKLGLSQSYFSRLVGGQRDLKFKHLEGVAKELDQSIGSLIVEDRVTPSATPSGGRGGLTLVNVVGYVQAGNWREADTLDAMLEELFIPPDPRWTKPPVAFRVLGDSYDQHVREGGYVIALRYSESPVELKKGMTVVAERSRYDGQMIERTLKMVFPLKNGTYELRPCSSNKAHKAIRFPSSENETHTTVYAVVTTFVQPAAWPE